MRHGRIRHRPYIVGPCAIHHRPQATRHTPVGHRTQACRLQATQAKGHTGYRPHRPQATHRRPRLPQLHTSFSHRPICHTPICHSIWHSPICHPAKLKIGNLLGAIAALVVCVWTIVTTRLRLRYVPSTVESKCSVECSTEWSIQVLLCSRGAVPLLPPLCHKRATSLGNSDPPPSTVDVPGIYA